MVEDNQRKSVLLVIAHEGFQQVEYGEPKRILLDAGIAVVTASNLSGQALGKDMVTRATVDVTLEAVRTEDYDGIFFIGGPGALPHLDIEESYRILHEIEKSGKPFGSICISTRILAKAGVLTGKQATGWNGDGALPAILSAHGVAYVPAPVVVDGRIITAEGPSAAGAFGKAIVEKLSSIR